MRTVTFASVLKGAARLEGKNPDATGYSDLGIDAELTHHINTGYRAGWEYYDWPEAMSYEACAIVVNGAVADSKYIPYINAATGRDMKTVYGLSTYDPRVKLKPGTLARDRYHLGPDGIYFPETSLTTLWVEFRTPAAKFTNTAWDAAVTYAVGDLVYYATTGECYKSMQTGVNKNPVSQTAYWTKQDFMALLDEAVKAGCFAARTRAEGRVDTATIIQNVVQDHLEMELDEIDQQSGRGKSVTRR